MSCFKVVPIFHGENFRSFCRGEGGPCETEAWTLLRIFPQELLKKIPQKLKADTGTVRDSTGQLVRGTGIVNMKSNIYNIIRLYIVVIVNVIYVYLVSMS